MEKLDSHFLIAMPNMGDTRFEKTVVLVCAHSNDGAMGFIINKILQSPTMADFFQQLNVLGEGEASLLPPELRKAQLRTGGPVEPGRGFVLHSPDFTSATTLQVSDEICLTATLEILRAMSTGRGPKKALLALGYSGWASGQLEEEIAANGWLTVPGDASILFDCDNDARYARSLEKLGVDPLLLSGEAGHA
jgi:putative transcriptional regulator